MSYNQLVKHYSNIREYLRDFYVLGYKKRSDYTGKERLYDDARRRLDSWIGVTQMDVPGSREKISYLSIDTRTMSSSFMMKDYTNPLYQAYRTRSYTDNDLILYMAIISCLSDGKWHPLSDIHTSVCNSTEFMGLYHKPGKKERTQYDDDDNNEYDLTTVRKKLREYLELGIIQKKDTNKKKLYALSDCDALPESLYSAISFFTETSPLGVAGAYLKERDDIYNDDFQIKHYYILNAIDSDIVHDLLSAINSRSKIRVKMGDRDGKTNESELVPLFIFISTQNGRMHLAAKKKEGFLFIRTDYISSVKMLDPCPDYDKIADCFNRVRDHIWGVSSSFSGIEKVEMTLFIPEENAYALRRLEGEGRGGRIEKIGDQTYRYTKEVFDSLEMIPWLRTFTGYIKDISFSNPKVENIFRNGMKELISMYE